MQLGGGSRGGDASGGLGMQWRTLPEAEERMNARKRGTWERRQMDGGGQICWRRRG